jgi:hypothetical protein
MIGLKGTGGHSAAARPAWGEKRLEIKQRKIMLNSGDARIDIVLARNAWGIQYLRESGRI